MATKEAVLQKVPKGSLCQEASSLSRETYIPCMAHATKVIFHPRDGKSYFMCEPCADHNLKNRGAQLAAAENPDPQPIPYDIHAAVNAVLAAEPKPIREPATEPQAITTIKQAELLEYVGLRNTIKKLQADLDTREDNFKHLLGANAPVEDGPLTASLKYGERRSPSWKDAFLELGDQLKGKGQGEKLAAKVLERTVPTSTISLVVK